MLWAASAAQKKHGYLDAGVAIDSDTERLQFVVVSDLARCDDRQLPPERTDQRQEHDSQARRLHDLAQVDLHRLTGIPRLQRRIRANKRFATATGGS